MVSLNCFAQTTMRLGRPAAIAAIALMTLSSLADAHEYKSGSLTILHPWARATVRGARVAGGYFTVKNNGAQPDRLIAVSADISDKSEIHEMAMNGDTMQMRALEGGLPIPAQGTATLKPGSFHIMFMSLKRQLKEGEFFKGTLTFEKAGTVPVEFKVEPMGATSSSHPNH